MKEISKKNWEYFVLGLMVAMYIAYFSFFTILRYNTLYASYYDLGIMQQTVYNTYRALVTHEPARILELTNTLGSNQITRMAIHNDLFLALMAPFFFINSSPATLLILQTIVLAIGAVAIFKIAHKVIGDSIFSLIFTFAYLMYTPMQRANIFDFHSVTFATTFLLWMFYFWMVKNYKRSFIFFLLALSTKEEVPLVTSFFALYVLAQAHSEDQLSIFQHPRKFILSIFYNIRHSYKSEKKNIIFATALFLISIAWFIISIFVIIPHFRAGDTHFALEYYSDLKDDQIGFLGSLFHIDSARYFYFLLGPLGFLSFLSPIHLSIAIPEFAINLFSSNWNMRNIIYHYTSVIQPFVFISAIYGAKKLIDLLQKRFLYLQSKFIYLGLAVYLIAMTMAFSYFKGPLPFSKEHDIDPYIKPYPAARDVSDWATKLQYDAIKVAATGHAAPHFASRRYLYTVETYQNADYVIIQTEEALSGGDKSTQTIAYRKLQKDPNFVLVYNKHNLEVYKKIIHISL